MFKFYFILPILAISFSSDTFCDPIDSFKDISIKKEQNKLPKLKRKNQMIFDKKINEDKTYNNNYEMYNDYVVVDKDDIIIEEEDRKTKHLLNEINKNKQIKPQYNEIKKEYDLLMEDSNKQLQLSENEINEQYNKLFKNSMVQLQLSQDKLNKQNEIINDMNNTTQQYSNKKKLKQYFQKIIKLLLQRNNFKTINRINNNWKEIIKNSITTYKFDKQYVKNTWETIYKKNKSKLNQYNFNVNQIEIFNLNKAIEFINNCYNKNNLSETLQKIISTILKVKSIEVINKGNKAWNSAIKLAINEDKLSKKDVKSIWNGLYNEEKQLLEAILYDLCFGKERDKESNILLFNKMSETNLFDLNKAMRFIDSI